MNQIAGETVTGFEGHNANIEGIAHGLSRE
jgi:hypothetical protein